MTSVVVPAPRKRKAPSSAPSEQGEPKKARLVAEWATLHTFESWAALVKAAPPAWTLTTARPLTLVELLRLVLVMLAAPCDGDAGLALFAAGHRVERFAGEAGLAGACVALAPLLWRTGVPPGDTDLVGWITTAAGQGPPTEPPSLAPHIVDTCLRQLTLADHPTSLSLFAAMWQWRDWAWWTAAGFSTEFVFAVVALALPDADPATLLGLLFHGPDALGHQAELHVAVSADGRRFATSHLVLHGAPEPEVDDRVLCPVPVLHQNLLVGHAEATIEDAGSLAMRGFPGTVAARVRVAVAPGLAEALVAVDADGLPHWAGILRAHWATVLQCSAERPIDKRAKAVELAARSWFSNVTRHQGVFMSAGFVQDGPSAPLIDAAMREAVALACVPADRFDWLTSRQQAGIALTAPFDREAETARLWHYSLLRLTEAHTDLVLDLKSHEWTLTAVDTEVPMGLQRSSDGPSLIYATAFDKDARELSLFDGRRDREASLARSRVARLAPQSLVNSDAFRSRWRATHAPIRDLAGSLAGGNDGPGAWIVDYLRALFGPFLNMRAFNGVSFPALVAALRPTVAAPDWAAGTAFTPPLLVQMLCRAVRDRCLKGSQLDAVHIVPRWSPHIPSTPLALDTLTWLEQPALATAPTAADDSEKSRLLLFTRDGTYMVLQLCRVYGITFAGTVLCVSAPPYALGEVLTTRQLAALFVDSVFMVQVFEIAGF